MLTNLARNIGRCIRDVALYAGDLINNDGLYTPAPDYTDREDRMPAMNAEIYECIGSRATAQWKKGFLIASMSTGYNAYQTALRFRDKVEENADVQFGEKFLTIQRLSDVVPSHVMQSDVLQQNVRNNEVGAEMAAYAFPDHTINAPADREGFLRTIQTIHPVLHGLSYEDSVFEKHIWGPEMLIDTQTCIMYGDKSYSRCGAMEQGVALAIQYAHPVALSLRNNEQIDIKDIHGQDISPVDQAWEDCKQVVDVVEMGFRAESNVALVLSRFMYDDWMKNKTGPLLHDLAHDTVRHQSESDRRRMKALKDVMLPYLAEKCDWKTLHAALDKDPDLKQYWDENVAPLKSTMKPAEEIRSTLFAYMPRGGWEHPKRDAFILTKQYGHEKTCRDESSPKQDFSTAGKKRRTLGSHENPYDLRFRARRFEDYDFERLGPAGNLSEGIAKRSLNRAQIAAMMITTALKKSRPPLKQPKTLLYLDSPASGQRAKDFMDAQGITDWSELKTTGDIAAQSGQSFTMTVERRNQEDYDLRRHWMLDQNAWHEEHGIGRILSLSDFSGFGQEFERERRSLHAHRREGIATSGPLKVGDAVKVATQKFIDQDADGLILPKGPILDENISRIMLRGLLVATGQIERPYDGGQYQMEFFEDQEHDSPPRKMDFGDILLKLGESVEIALDHADPPELHGAYVTMARILDLYEKITDPVNCNIVDEEHYRTGLKSQHQVLDINQISAHNPGFLSFLHDEPDKAARVKALHQRLRSAVQPGLESGIVRGKLLVRGIQVFEEHDLKDLPTEYRAAKEWRDRMEDAAYANILRQSTMTVRGPTISVS